ncbi:MAG: hypothetical protein ABFS18_13605 [Thermodesulfobacteriota bacterium]
MNKMVDPRYCKYFRKKDVCSNQNQELLAYLDNLVITNMSLTFEPEEFDKAFEYCASCAHFAPFAQVHDSGQASH